MIPLVVYLSAGCTEMRRPVMCSSLQGTDLYTMHIGVSGIEFV
jgi:hypothetical protein